MPTTAATRPPSRPRLLPATRWGKVALGLLMLVALCRSLAMASSQPALLAPDEDYHWNYVNYLVTTHSFPHIDSKSGTGETSAMAELTLQGLFLAGPVVSVPVRPHEVVKRLGDLPGSYINPIGAGAMRNVLHAPGWHLGAAVVDRASINASPVTRLTLMRYYSAVLGMVGVFFAWLLASQVLARIWQQLAVAALLVFQPIAAFSSSTMTNDVLVLAGITATLAWCAFLLRTPPSPRQGIGLGLTLSLALLAKSTALALVPIILLTVLLVWRTYPQARRAVLGVLGWATGITALLAGWWYLYVLVDTHTILGGAAPIGDTPPGGNVHSIGYVPEALWNWLRYVYPGYWFEYLGYEVNHDVWYYLPVVLGLIFSAGLLWRVVELRRALFDRVQPELRQILVLVAMPLVLLLPPMLIDLQNSLRGLGYTQVQARFLVPAFPAVAVLMVIGLRQLTNRVPRLFPFATGLLVVFAGVFYVRTYAHWNLERYYGPFDGHIGRVLDRVGFLKPEWVGEAWFVTLFAIAVAASVAALVLTLVGSLRAPTAGADPSLPPRAGELPRPLNVSS